MKAEMKNYTELRRTKDPFQVKHPKPIQLVTIQKKLRQKLIQVGVRTEENSSISR